MPRSIFQTLFRAGRLSSADPATTLRQFAAGDLDSFAELIDRYGPMVYGVCRRVLGPTPDADDAFQNTFLALAGHAQSIRDPGCLPGWLHRTALNAARKSRSRGAPAREPGPELASNDDPLAEASWREVRQLLDEELNALSAALRGPLVLCYLEARTHEDAARLLGLSVSTLKRRLDRGRELLRVRMVRRGVGAVGLATAVLGSEGLTAAVPGPLLRGASKQVAARIPVNGPGVLGIVAGSLSRSWSRVVVAGLAVIGVAVGTLLLVAGDDPARPAAQKATAGPPVAPPLPNVASRVADPLPDGATARLGTGWLRGRRCQFSPDGKAVVREGADGGLQLYEVPTGRPLARIRATDVPERKEIIGSTIGFSPDGKLLAAALWEGRCGIWETATGKLVRWLESGKFFSILTCEFSRDGTLLAVGNGVDGRTDNNLVGVFEVASGRRLLFIPGTNGAFAPDGKSLVTWNGYSGDQQKVRRVSIPDGRALDEFDNIANLVEYGPLTGPSDGRWYFEGASPTTVQHRVRVWDLAAGKVVHTFDCPAMFILHAPDKRELFVANRSVVQCWNLETGKKLWSTDLPEPASCTALSADGTTLVTGHRVGTVTVWDAATGTKRKTFSVAAIGHSPTRLVSPDGRTIVTESDGWPTTSIAFWDTATGKLLTDLPGHSAAITAVAFSPGGKSAYTVGRDRTLRVWNPADGQELARFAADPAEHLIASPDGATLFAVDPGGLVRILDVRTGKTSQRFPAFTKSLIGLALTADGKQMIVGGHDEPGSDVLRVIDPTTGKTLREFARTDGAKLEQIAVRPDGQMIVASYLGREVIVWSSDGKRVAEHRGRSTRKSAWVKGDTPYEIGSVAASTDGRWFAYSDQEEGVVILDARTGREEKRVKLPEVFYQNSAARYELRDVLAFAPDGKTVAWSGVESTADVYLIEVRSGQVRRKLPGDSYPVQQLVFTPDGAGLVSAGPDGSALVWDVVGRTARKGAEPADPARVAGWWTAISEGSAEKADVAMLEMTAHPASAVALLRERLQPVKSVAAAELDQLVARLGGADFKDREATTQTLITIGDAASPRLREETRSTNPEIARRAAVALNRIESADRIRAERAVEVLERIADPAAIGLLRELARGMPGAAMTVDAAGAVARVTAGGKVAQP
jgi:RNA polymerase sigma factor (sigma-70 family)